ncbi:hypothetical protein JVT61DRAFT_10349 [Boletus reticuloceps]|uniref:Uncharacterized protein n=1 Tax=Boletus reticuloceps TaxID=495285 RepID=A0A8I2YV09_9AGAM|nr:hypothetical protein JVT61DRAFT_10349 [Boletus reticuloceps]
MGGRGSRKQSRQVCTNALPVPASAASTAPPVSEVRPACQCCPPTQYRNGESEDERELLDIHEDSPSPSDSDLPSSSPPHGRIGTRGIMGNAAAYAVNTTRTDPLATSNLDAQTRSRTIAFDIHHFFRKEAERTTCIPCDPKTANGPLWIQLESKHMLAYLEMLEKEHWLMQSKLLKAAFSTGYMFNTLRGVLSKPGYAHRHWPMP